MGKEDIKEIERRIEEAERCKRKELKKQRRAKMKQEKISFWSDFKKFITKGNVLDMAVGVVVGTAFNAIVNTLVKQVITPFVTYFTSGVSINEWKWVLREAVEATETTEEITEIAIQYGLWLQTIVDFLIIAFTIFVVVRLIRKMERKIRAKELEEQELETKKKKAEEDAKAAAAKAAADAKAAEEKAIIDEYYANIREQSALLREIAEAVKK